MNNQVGLQYELYPYPFRDPEAEKPGKTKTIANALPLIGHYLFNGSSRRFQTFRVLVAGGGTGDATVHLAEQLAAGKSAGEVIHLDISAASNDIAQRRIEKLGLKNVRFVQGSLLDLAEMGLGDFDYIDCTGVLHHLEEPLAGVKVLRSVLKHDGGMSIMLYGELGRIGVYHLQEMIRMLRLPENSLEDLIGIARDLVGKLPRSNWLLRSRWIQLSDRLDDNEIVDLLLHVRDRAYRVSEVFDLMEAAGFRIVSFLPPFAYDSRWWMPPGDKLRTRFNAFSPRENAVFAELLTGGPNRHIFFAVPGERKENTVVNNAGSEKNIPVLINPDMKPPEPGKAGTLNVIGSTMPFTELEGSLLYYIDGKRSLSDIFISLQANPQIQGDTERYQQAWNKIFQVLNAASLLVLKTD